MTIIDNQRAEIVKRVMNLEPGEKFCLRTLYGEDAFKVAIPKAGLRKSLGTYFREAVGRGDFPMVAYSHHADSPSEHWYTRIVPDG